MKYLHYLADTNGEMIAGSNNSMYANSSSKKLSLSVMVSKEVRYLLYNRDTKEIKDIS